MKTLCNSIDPQKEAEREAIKQQTDAYIAKHGPITTQPLRPMSDDGMRVQDGKVQLTIVNKQRWKERAIQCGVRRLTQEEGKP
jgi:hypothetical protein